mmetsp:Transcript_43907/g.116007  ORF Transcript_43907/g.116007 Transcript_43907/m.116007 type:complete len:294 (+) Transcript_43907:2216-3097(+)
MHRQHKRVFGGIVQQQSVGEVKLFELCEVTEQHVVHLSHHLAAFVIARANIQIKTHIWRKGNGFQIGNVNATSNGIVFCTDVERGLILVGRSVIRHLILLKRTVVDTAVLETIPSITLFHVLLPSSTVLGSVRIIENTSALAHTHLPLTRVAIVHLLRRAVAHLCLRTFWRQPLVATFTMWVSLFPVARIMFVGSITPQHGPLARHCALFPVTLVHIATGPHLPTLTVLLSSFPLALVVRTFQSVVSESPMPVPLSLEPVTVVRCDLVGGNIDTTTMSPTTRDFSTEGGTVRP